MPTSSTRHDTPVEFRKANAEVPMAAFYEKYNAGPQGLLAQRRALGFSAFRDVYDDQVLEGYQAELRRARASANRRESGEDGPTLEVAVWQAFECYQPFGPDVRLIPTSEYDDDCRGTDFVLEWKDGDSIVRIGVDDTLEEPETKRAKEEKKKGTYAHSLDYELDGSLRRVAFFKSQFTDFPGYEEEDGKRYPGIWMPRIFASIANKDLYQYCIEQYDPVSKQLKTPQEFLNEHPNHPFFEAIRESILKGIDAELVEVKKFESQEPDLVARVERALDAMRSRIERPLEPRVTEDATADATEKRNLPYAKRRRRPPVLFAPLPVRRQSEKKPMKKMRKSSD